MGVFKFFKRSGQAQQPQPEDVYNIDRAINELISQPNGPMNVSVDNALGLATVWACIQLLSNSVGILPLHLYRRGKDGRERVKNHPALRVLSEPSEYWNRFDLIQWIMSNALARGNGYARIYRDFDYVPTGIAYLKSEDVSPYLDDNTGHLHYRVGSQVLTPDDIIHIKGLGTDPLKGKSPIAVHRENLALAIEAQGYGESFFSRGGNVESVFEYPAALKKEAYERLKTDLRQQVVGMANAHQPLILEGGMKYNRINIPLEDAQFIQTRKFQRSEIAAIFGVPPHMIGDLDKATYNNTELMGIEYVTYTLMPWLVKIQAEFARKLLREDEKDSLYFAFQTNGLMRGDAKSRSEFYKNMSMIGAMNANEIRELEDMNSYEGGDRYFVQLNMQDAADAGKEDNNNSSDE
jgi:HK97 family phage portal protein